MIRMRRSSSIALEPGVPRTRNQFLYIGDLQQDKALGSVLRIRPHTYPRICVTFCFDPGVAGDVNGVAAGQWGRGGKRTRPASLGLNALTSFKANVY